MKSKSNTKPVQQCDVVATIFAAHKVSGPIADKLLDAACAKLDKLGGK